MVCDKNREYLKNEIIGQSRHQFIYGYNNEERKSFFQELAKKYPIKNDCVLPMAIYLDDFGLPNFSIQNSELDNYKIDMFCREYLYLTIAYTILVKSKENLDFDLLNSRIGKIIEFINRCNINQGYLYISNLNELIKVLEDSKEFYKKNYIDYVKNGKECKSINSIALPFLELEYFVGQYKKVLNNQSYFAIILDKNQDIAYSSTKAVNSLVGSRINKDISMKVVVEPDKWDSNIALDGEYVQSVHDYGIVEFDESEKEYVKKLKRQSK